MPNNTFDPLRIYYYPVLREAAFEDFTPFQGFSPGWVDLIWAGSLLSILPADISEPSMERAEIWPQRISGTRFVNILPIDINSLEQVEDMSELGFFTVLISSETETNLRVKKILKDQKKDIYHISVSDDQTGYEFDFDHLKNHFIKVLQARKSELNQERFEFAEKSLRRWKDPEWSPSNHEELGHNIFIPNQLALERCGLTTEKDRWMGSSEAEYTKEVIKSAKCVSQLRDKIGAYDYHRIHLPTPEIILTEPSIGRQYYKTMPPRSTTDDVAIFKAMRRFQTQRGLHQSISKSDLDVFIKSKNAQSLVNIRQQELAIYTMGISLRASSDCSAVLRMSPGVNHVYGKLKTYASNIRTSKPEARRKTKRLFNSIQNDLVKYVGLERINYIKERRGRLKIVSDAPLEWLPIDGLPLSLRYDCSRINTTPGNLMMGTLLETSRMVLEPNALKHILIISAFDKDDPLRNMMKIAIDTFLEGKKHELKVDFVKVSTISEFIDAVNNFTGSILVFDGHGSDNAFYPVSHLIIGGEKIDIWSLRRKIRVPPIVMLSACDTHSLDGTTHATVANGFLMLGARTVLATFLPIEGRSAATFIARILYRIDAYLDIVMDIGWRALSWNEVVTGMLRMQFQSEIFDHVFGPLSSEERRKKDVFDLQARGNQIINFGDVDWYEQVLTIIAEHTSIPYENILKKAETALARSETIRYVQLGNPETIIIARNDLVESVMKADESS